MDQNVSEKRAEIEREVLYEIFGDSPSIDVVQKRTEKLLEYREAIITEASEQARREAAERFCSECDIRDDRMSCNHPPDCWRRVAILQGTSASDEVPIIHGRSELEAHDERVIQAAVKAERERVRLAYEMINDASDVLLAILSPDKEATMSEHPMDDGQVCQNKGCEFYADEPDCQNCHGADKWDNTAVEWCLKHGNKELTDE